MKVVCSTFIPDPITLASERGFDHANHDGEEWDGAVRIAIEKMKNRTNDDESSGRSDALLTTITASIHDIDSTNNEIKKNNKCYCTVVASSSPTNIDAF